MSLLRIRKERKAGTTGNVRPPALWKLVVGLVLVALLIWYLARLA